APARGRGHVEPCNGQGGRLVAKFGDNALRQLLAYTGRLLHRRPVLQGDGTGEILRRKRAKHGQGHLGPYALDGLQQAEPGALDPAGEPEQAKGTPAHVRLDGEAHRLTRLQGAQGAGGGLHLIAHAPNIDDGVALAHRVDHALELADHARAPSMLAGWSGLAAAARDISAPSPTACPALAPRRPGGDW